MKDKLVFTKTIRFKLTLIFSLITFLFAGTLVFSLNIYLHNYLKTEPPGPKSVPVWVKEIYPLPGGDDFLIKYREAQMKTIREIRLNDLKEIQRLSIISIFPIALLSFVLGYLLSGRFLKPISNLEKEISVIKREDLGRTIKIKSDDEVGRLIASFNELSLRLKASFDSQDRFVQDAQHELKTPMTIIQTNLDTALVDETATKEELRDSISNSLKGIKSLKKLVNDLLDLTLPAEKVKEDIDINSLIKNIVNQLEVYAQNLGVELKMQGIGEATNINGNKIALERAIYNIIENAIKYSAESKSAQVNTRITKEGKNIIIKIEDNGPGISKDHQHKIFDRFYRVDKSRSRKSGGFGLGLSIAKKFIEDNGGEIKLQSTKGKTVFTVAFTTTTIDSLPLHFQKEV